MIKKFNQSNWIIGKSGSNNLGYVLNISWNDAFIIARQLLHVKHLRIILAVKEIKNIFGTDW